jgi:uncharacterized protein YcbK (DUF882 family)
MSRRTFLWGAAATLLLLRPRWAEGLLPAPQATVPRRLEFVHTHTRETLEIEYWRGGGYDLEALARINRFLRDFRTDDVAEIDPQLLDILHELARTTGTRRPFQVISGFRSRRTNEMLRNNGHAVAKSSQHMLGHAIDVRLADVSTATLRDAAIALGRGGVGYYAGDNFVHVDTGRVRTW